MTVEPQDRSVIKRIPGYLRGKDHDFKDRSERVSWGAPWPGPVRELSPKCKKKKDK